MQQSENYQDFLKWGGGRGGVFRSLSYNNKMNKRVSFLKICNLTPHFPAPPLQLGKKEYIINTHYKYNTFSFTQP